MSPAFSSRFCVIGAGSVGCCLGERRDWSASEPLVKISRGN